MATNTETNGIPISQLPTEDSPAGVYVPGLKSERNVKVDLGLLATKNELQNAVVGTNLLGSRADIATIKSEIITPSKGDTYSADDTGHYWKYNDVISEANPYDPNKWVDIGVIIPSSLADYAKTTDTSGTIIRTGELTQTYGQSIDKAVSQKAWTDGFNMNAFNYSYLERISTSGNDSTAVRKYGINVLEAGKTYKIALTSTAGVTCAKTIDGSYLLISSLSTQGDLNSKIDDLIDFRKSGANVDIYKDTTVYYTPNQDCYIYLYAFITAASNAIVNTNIGEPLQSYIAERTTAIEEVVDDRTTMQGTIESISTFGQGVTEARIYSSKILEQGKQYKINLTSDTGIVSAKVNIGSYLMLATVSTSGVPTSRIDTLFQFNKTDGGTDPFIPSEIIYTPSVRCYLYLYAVITAQSEVKSDITGDVEIKEVVKQLTEQTESSFIDVDGSMKLSEILSANGLQHKAINTSQGAYNYTGEKVLLKPYKTSTYNYEADVFMDIAGLGSYDGTKGAQGFTIYGDVGFMFYDKGYCKTIDLINKTIISAFALSDPARNDQNHAGQANFGNEFHTVGDEFPVLYLSSYIEKKCYVFRMTRTSAVLVQTIYLTDGTKDVNANFNLLDAQAFFPDIENDKMIIKMGGTDANNQKYKYWKVFDMPLLNYGEVYYLLEDKQSDEFFVRTLQMKDSIYPNWVNAGFAMNGKIYICAGFEGSSSRLLVIDYEKRKILTDVKWIPEFMTDGEQEQCCFYKGSLMINYQFKNRLVKVTF